MTTLHITALTAPLGATVHGLSPAQQPAPETAHALRKALDTHLLLLLKGMSVSPSQLVTFAASFGEPASHGIVVGLAGHNCITDIRKEPEHWQNYGGTWHSDLSFQTHPPVAAVLQAKELPTTGGDTLWSNQYLAYEGLPQHLRERVDVLSAEHTSNIAFGGMAHDAVSTVHPLAPVHPRTGRRYLYVNPVSIVRLLANGDEVDDGAELLAHLIAHATQTQLLYRHSWSVGDVLVWDNRSTLHMAMNDYPGQRRVMHRVVVIDSANTRAPAPG